MKTNTQTLPSAADLARFLPIEKMDETQFAELLADFADESETDEKPAPLGALTLEEKAENLIDLFSDFGHTFKRDASAVIFTKGETQIPVTVGAGKVYAFGGEVDAEKGILILARWLGFSDENLEAIAIDSRSFDW